jgi:hypothetical protein
MAFGKDRRHDEGGGWGHADIGGGGERRVTLIVFTFVDKL